MLAMSKEIIDRLNKHIQFCMDRKTEAYERDAALIRDAVARIAELEVEVTRQKEMLEALKGIAEKRSDFKTDYDYAQWVVNVAKAVIAKAEGVKDGSI